MKTDLTVFDEDNFGKPLEKLTLDELTSLGTELLDYAQILGKRTALMTYEAGRVLFEIRARLRVDGGWVRWQMEQGLARSTVGNVIALYENVQDIKKLHGLTIMDAYRKFGVLAPRKNEQKALPQPGDETTAEPERRYPDLSASADEQDLMEGLQEGVINRGNLDEQGSIVSDEDYDAIEDAIDVPLSETITVDRETLQELLQASTKDIVMSVIMKCFDDVNARVFERLEIADDEMPLANAALGGLLQANPIEPDARFEVALDKMYSALLQIQDVGLQGSARETAWLLEKLVLAAQGRLKRAG